jgi:hypothetical protein
MSVVSSNFEKLKRFNLEELRAIPPAKEAEPKEPNAILEDQ